jgi:NADPH:quinone reductase-like Zn-dependent oxidoreductase
MTHEGKFDHIRTTKLEKKAMKAFVVDRYKSKDAVLLGEMPEPKVRDDDVLLQVHAASLNQLDSKIRDGEFKLILSIGAADFGQ